MNRQIGVFLGEAARRIGTLRFDVQGARESAGFEYHPDWLAANDRFAIEPGLPLVAGMQFHARNRGGSPFHGAVADTEPDGWGRRVILRDHARRRLQARQAGEAVAASPLNAVDFLLSVDDASRVGALRFQDEDGVFQRAAQDDRQAIPPLVELRMLMHATQAVETHTETAADLQYLRGRGTSLGGLRPKCTVVDEQGHLSIGKFPSVSDDREVTRGEVLALRLADKAGIDASQARIVDSDGVPVALIRRFDRPDAGGRLMYVSAATLLDASDNDDVEHAYTEIADALRMNGAAAQADIEELWRRIAFSILITNVDDHLHNHGFLHVEHGQWRLAPAFDVNPFPERARELKTWISEESGPEATVPALMSAVPYFGITFEKARGILAEVEQAVSTWRETGRALGMSNRSLDSFADAFEHPERATARKAGL
ncbi:MAG: type II toxin-antitoxin system HipA family toxin [Gammaproteobacteria bacterium]